MSNLSQWSSSAGGNTAAAPNGAPENMSPSSVNDTMREMMAGTRRWYEDAEWIDRGNTPTFATTASFTIAGDHRTPYHTGRRIRCSDATILYGKISDVSYSTNTRVSVTLDSGQLSASLTAVAVGLLSFTNQSIPESSATASYARSASYANSASSAATVTGVLAKSNLPSTVAYEDEANVFSSAQEIDNNLHLYHANAGADAGYAINSYTNTTGSTKATVGHFGVYQNTLNTRDGKFAVFLADGGAPVERFRITTLGNVQPSGGYTQPGSGGETLKTIRGWIAATGTTPTEGTGFTVTHTNGTGIYTITYSTAFSDVPAVQVTLVGANGFCQLYNGGTASAVRIDTFNTSASATDIAFHFIAIGPP